MNTPPLLVGAALLFWGWQTGLLWLGVLVGVMLESLRLLRVRWEFAQADLDRVWNLCVLLFFGAGVITFASNDGASAFTGLFQNVSPANRLETLNKGARSVILFFQWVPLMLLPIVIAQAVSQRERMDWSTFSWWLRRQRRLGKMPIVGSGVNVAFPYFVTCLIAASAADERTIWFSAGLVSLTGWALWSRRPRSFGLPGWCLCFAAVVGMGIAAQLGLRQLQQIVRQLDAALVSRFAGGRGVDPNETRTMLGEIGRLKLSGRIALRVETDGQPPPELLREASYNLLKSPFWSASTPARNFGPTVPENDVTRWKLLPDKSVTKMVTVSGYLPGGKGVIAVPHGVAQLEDLPAGELATNRLGALRVTDGPGFVRYRALYDDGTSIDTPPDGGDLVVAPLEKPVIEQVGKELKLSGLRAEQALKTVEEFFANNFRYTTWLGEERRTRSAETALSRFLLKNRAGHCEYFATATVLLLREAGIPARYATGFSVQEKKGTQWVVRDRHAHAWCLAWVNGAWRDMDTTPASWSGIEAARAAFWERIADAWSRAWFEFSKWRWGKGDWKQYLIWLVIPLIAFAGWRLITQKQWNRARNKASDSPGGPARPGLDSEFFQIVQELAKLGLERRSGETLSAWLARIHTSEALKDGGLGPLLALHYRLRFDPAGLGQDGRSALSVQSEEWLHRNHSRGGSQPPRTRKAQTAGN